MCLLYLSIIKIVSDGPYEINIIPSGNVIKVENDSLILTCDATCNPHCQYNWVKDGQQVGDRDTLEFTSIRRSNHGSYRCRASNNIGSDQYKDVFIEVQCKYVFIEGNVKIKISILIYIY